MSTQMAQPIPLTTSPKTIAFFGATGGCGLACLVRSLKAGHTCTALVRTPSKLLNLLVPHLGPDPPKNLHITAGSSTNTSTVHSFLTTIPNPPEIIISSVGASPKFQLSLIQPITLDQPTVCSDTAAAIISALRSLKSTNPGGYIPPVMCVVSTTGTGKTVGEDVPALMTPVYKYLLQVPHEDKKQMEKAVMDAGSGQGREELLGAWVVVLAAGLVDKAWKGTVRAGYDGRVRNGGKWGDCEGRAVGYTVGREEVGAWIWEEVIEGKVGGEWWGKRVTLAY